jgi:nucleoid DNA-binding protein
MSTVTKKKLIMEISQKKGVHPNDVRNVIQAFLDSIIDSLADGDRLEFRDFGVFEVVQRKQKIGRNPKKPSVPIVIPSRSAVKFTPGRKMKEQIEDKVQVEKEGPTSKMPASAPQTDSQRQFSQ